MSVVKYRVADIRAFGLECKWSKTRDGIPIIVARNPAAESAHQREKWWVVNQVMWNRARKVGLVQAFNECTALGNFFSVEL
jgi:hypothetical protein